MIVVLVVFIGALILGMVCLTKLNKKWIINLAQTVVEFLKRVYVNQPIVTIIILSLWIEIVMVFSLPFLDLCYVISILTVNNNFISFLVTYWATNLGSVTVFFVTKTQCGSWALSKLSKISIFDILKKQALTNQYRYCFIIRVMYISQGIKDYLMGFIGVGFAPFCVSALIVHFWDIAKVFILFYEIQHIKQFYQQKNWSEQSWLQKLLLLIIFVLLICTYVLFFIFGLYIKKTLKRK